MEKKFLDRKTYGKTLGGGIPVLPVNPIITIPNPFLLPDTTSTTPIYFGNKRYELSDWLGNVRVVVNDRKTPVNTGTTTVSYFPQVTSVSDYYSFGSQIAERSYDPVKPLYRFGFNTQEKVNEITPDHYTAKYWEYDARLGRRWNVDPKPQAGVSNYAVNEDNPIRWNDPLGDIPPELLVRGGKITSSFQPREKITEGGQKIFYVHRAMDIAAQVGKKIHSYASGTVVIVGTEKDKSGKLKGWGNYIVIKHNEGFYSLYAHLDKLPNLKLGQKVQNDEIIGNVGKTGSATGPHLHIEIGKAKNLSEFLSNKQETRLNPEKIGDLEKFIDFYKENKDKINIDEYKKNTTDNIEKVNLNKK